MSAFSVRNVLPVVVSLAATLFLATAVPHDLVPEPAAPTLVAKAALERCVAGGRAEEECLDEADGIALIERADESTRAGTGEASR